MNDKKIWIIKNVNNGNIKNVNSKKLWIIKNVNDGNMND